MSCGARVEENARSSNGEVEFVLPDTGDFDVFAEESEVAIVGSLGGVLLFSLVILMFSVHPSDE